MNKIQNLIWEFTEEANLVLCCVNKKVNFTNLMKRTVKELAFILDSAIVGQIRALKKTVNYDKNLYMQLRRFIKKFRKNFQKFLEL